MLIRMLVKISKHNRLRCDKICVFMSARAMAAVPELRLLTSGVQESGHSPHSPDLFLRVKTVLSGLCDRAHQASVTERNQCDCANRPVFGLLQGPFIKKLLYSFH